MRRCITSTFDNKAIVVMAADHGVVAEGVSAYPQSVTRQMVHPFLTGCAAVNVFARHIGARVVVADMGVIGGFVGFYTFHGLAIATKNQNVSLFMAAWLACVVSALACSVEMYLAGTFPLVPGLIAMGLYHAAIGVIEGGITVFAANLIAMARPDIVVLPKAVSC